MKRLLQLAAAAMLATATGAHAQSGPVNHQVQAGRMTAPAPPMEADMAAPPPPEAAMAPPAPGFASQLDQTRTTVQTDLDQHKISHRKAARLLRELSVIKAKADTLDRRLGAITTSLP